MKVLVVGAGLAGLTAATQLTALGHDIVVLEGRDQIGGRSRSHLVADDVIELGAQFISPNHRRMRQLVVRAGLHLARETGSVRWRGPHDQLGRITPQLGPADLVLLSRLFFGTRRLHSLPTARSHELDQAALDSLTVADWLAVLRRSRPAHHLMESLMGLLTGGADLSKVSLLEFTELLGREGGARRFLIGEVGLASHIVEGTGALCAYLAGKLNAQVHVNALITGIEQSNDGVAVRVDGGEVFEGDRAVVAVPTTVLSHIDFNPHLPVDICGANSAVHYGQANKIVAVVAPSTRVRAKAFVGGELVFAGWRTGRVLYGFANSNSHTLDANNLAEDLCRGFAVDPQYLRHIELVCWPQDPLARGTYAHMLPGRYLPYRRSLPHQHGRVHFAGAERSSWPIYMEGAVESGENVAHAVAFT